VLLDGTDVTDDPMYVRARKGIGYLPQEPSIFRGLTVEQNILAILETLDLDAAARRARLARPAGRAGADAAGALAGLYAVGRRAAARRDHPRARHVAALHPARRAVRRHRPDCRDRHPEDHLPPEGARDRVLITDHNVRETLRITDRAYIVHDGVIFRSGTPDSLAADEDVKRIYLGPISG
jgi:lipopolysaccharide export system ATP-binding protein